MKTKVDIINETVEYYSTDTKRRALLENGFTCRYLTSDGRRCAVGRCLIPDTNIIYLDENDETGLSTGCHITTSCGATGITNLEEILLPEYRGHDKDFWRAVQHLHDNNHYWDESGLTDDGKNYVRYTLNEYK